MSGLSPSLISNSEDSPSLFPVINDVNLSRAFSPKVVRVLIIPLAASVAVDEIAANILLDTASNESPVQR